jgi:hypothetical protein
MTMAVADGRRWQPCAGAPRIDPAPVERPAPGDPFAMSASSPVAPARWTATPPSRGLASRLVAGFLNLAAGIVLAAVVLGLSIASAVIARGTFIADPGDIATLHALTPVFALLAVVAAGHALAGLGIMLGSRAAASLGIGLGAFDVVAGIVALVVAAVGPKGQADGVGIAMTFIVVGVVLSVAARAADWNTHGPVEQP